MQRKALYSRAARRRTPREGVSQEDFSWADAEPTVPLRKRLSGAWKKLLVRHERIAPAIGMALVLLLLFGGWQLLHPAARILSQWDIDNAVHYTMSHTDAPPAEATIAAATVGPSVVRVEGYMSPEHAAEVAAAEEHHSGG